MKAWKYIRFGLMIALCVLLNLGGKMLASRFSLPLWLDAFGTGLVIDREEMKRLLNK